MTIDEFVGNFLSYSEFSDNNFLVAIMGPIPKISIIPKTSGNLSVAQAALVAQAIQQQVVTDFAPIWMRSAVVVAESNLSDGAIPVFVVDNVGGGMQGYHFTKGGYPFAMVEFGPLWSLAASHEILELLADPTANLLRPSVTPDGTGACQYLTEICDPCQDWHFSYPINGFSMSDFVTPHYYEPMPPPGAYLTFKNHIKAPRQLLPGGTLAWIMPNNHFIQIVSDVNGKITGGDRGLYQPGPLPARCYAGTLDKTFAKISNSELPFEARRALSKQRKEQRKQGKSYALAFDVELNSRFEQLNKKGSK